MNSLVTSLIAGSPPGSSAVVYIISQPDAGTNRARLCQSGPDRTYS
jgi:hypothetical protein